MSVYIAIFIGFLAGVIASAFLSRVNQHNRYPRTQSFQSFHSAPTRHTSVLQDYLDAQAYVGWQTNDSQHAQEVDEYMHSGYTTGGKLYVLVLLGAMLFAIIYSFIELMT
jgi:hypothetical protein